MRDEDTVVLETIRPMQEEARNITAEHTKCFMNFVSFELLGIMKTNMKSSGTR
jgi:hypothetical protein